MTFLSVAFLFGAVVGSFLNVCIVRIPHGTSIVQPLSHRPAYKKAFRFYDNIPLISYFGAGPGVRSVYRRRRHGWRRYKIARYDRCIPGLALFFRYYGQR